MEKKIPLLRRDAVFVFLAITIGIVLRSIQYFGSSSMWLDELASAKNIETRNYYELATQSLDFNQVAPIGFLFSQKILTSLFGVSDLAHRFLPWLASLFAVILFWRVSRKFLKGPYLLSALLFFSCCVSLIWLGSNEKHYSGEVAAVLFLIWAGISFSPGKKKAWYWVIGITGAVSCLLSFPAAVVALGILLLVFIRYKTEWKTVNSSFLFMAVLWFLGSSLNLIYGKLVVADRQVFSNMHEYWLEGFPPSLNPLELFPWITKNSLEVLGALLFLRPPRPLFILTLTIFLCALPGIAYAVKQKRINASMLLLPYLVGIALAVFNFYPWRHRVGLYSIWPFLIFFPMGLAAIGKWAGNRAVYKITRGFALVIPVLILLIVLIVGKPPFIFQPSQPVLKELKATMKPGDIIYVYCKGEYAMERYAPRVGINSWTTGHHYKVASQYKNDLQNLKSKSRVWFFYTQWTEAEPFPDSIRLYLETMGKQLKVISKPKGKSGQDVTAAYLYYLQ